MDLSCLSCTDIIEDRKRLCTPSQSVGVQTAKLVVGAAEWKQHVNNLASRQAQQHIQQPFHPMIQHRHALHLRARRPSKHSLLKTSRREGESVHYAGQVSSNGSRSALLCVCAKMTQTGLHAMGGVWDVRRGPRAKCTDVLASVGSFFSLTFCLRLIDHTGSAHTCGIVIPHSTSFIRSNGTWYHYF